MDPKAVGGVPWTLLTYAFNRGITLATTVVLARLLVPSDFGVVALASIVIGIIGLFKDLGLSGAMIVRQDLDERAQGVVFTMLVATGVVVMLLVAALALPTSEWLDEPQLDGVLVVMSLAVPIGSIGWFYETVLQRELEFRKRFIAQAIQAVVYALVALALAIAGAGVWSIVVAFVAGTAVYSVVLLFITPGLIAPRWDSHIARDVFRTGRGFLAQGGLGFIQQNGDKFIVGAALGAAPLGYYSMAYRLCELPYLAIADPVARVTFPEFARMNARGDDVSPAFLSVLRLIAIVTIPIGVILSGAAAPFVAAVLGSQWTPMVTTLTVLGIWASVRAVQTTVAWLLNSLGHSGLMGTVSAVVLAPLIVGVLIAAHHGGIEAVAWVMLADLALSLALLAYFAQTRGAVSMKRQWAAIGPATLAAVPAWFASRLVSEAIDQAPPVLWLAGAAAAGVLVYLAVLAMLDRDGMRVALSQVRRVTGRQGTVAA
jgi:PST family polysaccharide transporter